MTFIVVSIFLGVLAMAVLYLTVAGTGSSERVHMRLASLDREFVEDAHAENVADISKDQRKLSGIPWLNQWLIRINLAPASNLYLYQAGVNLTFGTLLLISVGGFAGLGCILYLRLNSVFPSLLISAIFLPLPFLYVRRKRQKRFYKLEQQLPEALSMMVSALRVGHSLIASLSNVAQESPAPIAGEIRKCFEEQNFGIDLRTALTNFTVRNPIQDFRIFVAAVLIQKESGGNLAEVLEKVAQTTRERFRLRKQVSVHTAQGRMTGWILSGLPVVLGFGMYFMNPAGMSVLWTRPIGLHILYTAIVMDVIGSLIIRKIVNIRV